jgi:hypothetical protein
LDIETRVELALTATERRDFIGALGLILPALEATARKSYGTSKLTSDAVKNFIRNKYFILEPFSLTGLDMANSKYPAIEIDTDNDKKIDNPDTADIIYHCYRNALAHGHDLSKKFVLSQPVSALSQGWNFHFGNGRVHLPVNIVWAIIAVVVFSKENKDLKKFTGSYLSLAIDDKAINFTVGLLWGQEDLIRQFFLNNPLPRETFLP